MHYIKKHKILIALLGLLILGAVLWWRSGHESAEVSIEETAEVKIGSVRKVLNATGIVKSQVGAVVKTGTRATGVIEKMLVRVGDKVTAGELIAKIDSREQEADLARAEAQLRSAKAEQVFADLAVRRIGSLSRQDLTSRESYDDARRVADKAAAAVDDAAAAFKSAEIVSLLRKQGANVHVIMTKNATQFVAPLTFETMSANPVVTDTFDPRLSGLTVTLNGTALTAPAQYTYDAATGRFATVAGVITVPAATFTQNAAGAYSVSPGTSTLTISGTI